MLIENVFVNEKNNENNLCNGYYPTPYPTSCLTPATVIKFNVIDNGSLENNVLKSICGIDCNNNEINNEICNGMIFFYVFFFKKFSKVLFELVNLVHDKL